MSPDERIGVLFVCHANICRSPLAEGLFREYVRRHNALDRFRIDSAGTWGMDGEPPHPLSCRIALEHGFELTSRSRSIEPEDLHIFDHILAMDRHNLSDLQRYRRLSVFGANQKPETQLRLFRTLADPRAQDSDLDVPDPIRQGIGEYEQVYALLEVGCDALVNELLG